MKTLKKVAESAVKQDKNDRNYKTVNMSTPQTALVDGRVVYLKPKISALNLFEKSYLNQQEEFGYSLPVGVEVQGAIETRNVQPYELPNTSKTAVQGSTRTVNTFSCIVLGDSDSPAWESKVKAEMLRKGHKVIETTGAVADKLVEADLV